MIRPSIKTVSKIACCAIAGAVVTLLVAWQCGRSPLERVSLFGPSPGWPIAVPSDWPPPDTMSEWRSLGFTFREHVAHGVPAQPDRNRSVSYYVIDECRAGLPFRSVVTRWPGPSSRPLPQSILDDAPLPIGFIADTTIYGAALWLVALGVDAARREARRRARITHRANLRQARVTCPRCSYDLRGLTRRATCPECGYTRAR